MVNGLDNMRFFHDIREYFSYARFAAKSALNAEVAGSYLNWLWWIFDPICMMLVYTFIFSYIFKAGEQYFPIFVFVGLTMWRFFQMTLSKSTKIVKNNKAIVSKVYLPKFILILTQMLINFIKMLISWGIIAGMMVVWQVPVKPMLLLVIPLFIVEAIFTFGICCLVMHFGVFVEDLDNVIRIAIQFIFYATGIFFSIESRIDNPVIQNFLLHYNPLAYIIASVRRCLLYQTLPEFNWLIIWAAISVVISVIAVRLIYVYENSYVKAI